MTLIELQQQLYDLYEQDNELADYSVYFDLSKDRFGFGQARLKSIDIDRVNKRILLNP